MGKAYGFFKCSASKREVEAELPSMRNAAETPSELETSLIEGLDNLRAEEGLVPIVRKAKRFDMNFVIEGNYPGKSNEETASNLGDILNMASASKLYKHKPEEDLCTAVVYQDGNGNYIERE